MKKDLAMRLLISFLVISLGMQNALSAQESMNSSLVYQWSDASLPASSAHNNTYNEIWGYEANGKEYAIIGSTMGTHIFDLTDGAESEIFFIEGAVQGTQLVHRDFDTYLGYLYVVADEGFSTLQIIDLNNLPNSAPVIYDSNELIIRAHNIFIDKDAGVLYRCGGNDQLSLFSLADPTAPTLIIDCDAEISNWSSTVGYVHDIFVRNSIAYCNTGGALYVVDFTTPTNPVILGSLTDYEDQGYNHSGWLHSNGYIYAMADETHGKRIKIIDVSDPTDMQVISLMGSEVDPLSIPHNLIFDGDFLHVSYYVDGYYVWNVSDPANPVLYAFYDTSDYPHTLGYKGAWGVYPFLSSGKVLVSDMQEGLFVLQNGSSNIGSHSTGDIGIFPNPLSGNKMWVSLPGTNSGHVNILVRDRMGRKVASYNSSVSGQQIELDIDCVPGLYLVTVSGDTFTKTIKLQKN